jgi:hypothetical protein
VRREIKDDECRRNKYKGENLASQTRIFRLKEEINDDECGRFNNNHTKPTLHYASPCCLLLLRVNRSFLSSLAPVTGTAGASLMTTDYGLDALFGLFIIQYILFRINLLHKSVNNIYLSKQHKSTQGLSNIVRICASTSCSRKLVHQQLFFLKCKRGVD